jgi:hypothetical protein
MIRPLATTKGAVTNRPRVFKNPTQPPPLDLNASNLVRALQAFPSAGGQDASNLPRVERPVP